MKSTVPFAILSTTEMICSRISISSSLSSKSASNSSKFVCNFLYSSFWKSSSIGVSLTFTFIKKRRLAMLLDDIICALVNLLKLIDPFLQVFILVLPTVNYSIAGIITIN